MSSATRNVLAVIVVVVIAAAAYYWYSVSYPTTDNLQSTNTAQQNSDTSDATVLQDSTAIDAQLTNLDADNASIDQSDQPVTQSY